jgi:flagellin-like protein
MQIKQELNEFVSDDSRAVSPVIGVILMVAITVILAAVIGTFVLGLGDSVQTNVQAGASVSSNPVSGSQDGTITVTFNSNQNAQELQVEATPTDSSQSVSATTGSSPLTQVGESVTFTEGQDADTEVQVIVTAVGQDGETRTVIVERTVTI